MMLVLKYGGNFKCGKQFVYSRISRRCCSQLNVCEPHDGTFPAEVKDSPVDVGDRVKNVENKVIYSSILHRNQILSWKEIRKIQRYAEKDAMSKRREKLKEHTFPISMRYMEGFISETSPSGSSVINLPIGKDNSEVQVSCAEGAEIVRSEFADSFDEMMSAVPASSPTVASLETCDGHDLVSSKYLESKISCGGCGAQIQCEQMYQPGYIPLEFLSSSNQNQKSTLLCQRCYFTRSVKVLLRVNYNPFSYLKGLTKLRSRRSLILAVFDVTDVSLNISSSIRNFVGEGHPVILIGNKVDLLPPDCHGYLNRVKNRMREIFKSNGHLNVKDVFLVSSSSGIGIESLITKLFSTWKNYGDIYLVGLTNVGKSSLFNALLNSDLCKALTAAEIQCATTSPWPGTTLGVLKFPLSRPAGDLMFERTKRLQVESKERKLLKSEESSKRKNEAYLASPDTFAPGSHEEIDCEMGTRAVKRTLIPLSPEKLKHLGLPPPRLRLDNVRWCYDTPGIPTSERTLDLLTPDEMKYAFSGSRMIIPRTFYVKVGLSLFVGGLARLDYDSGDQPIWMTVFAPRKLPVLLCASVDAEEVYSTLLGSPLLGVPRGEKGRLNHWPPFVSKPYEVTGIGWKESCADVLLSSAGWVAITAKKGLLCRIRAHTPNGFGIEMRTPCLMPYSVRQKGPRRMNSPVYSPLNDHVFTKYS
ncbi:nitric oxide-associated protein 1 [Ischnura elegans]|uniref:nitric oxide-associated protein 1 n=1 Tax=Ischnura elegans TaxID=197161 RepID=UPI001ED8A14D|nr:nitric oxide-associated protein 1 [Ischnura elegans]